LKIVSAHKDGVNKIDGLTRGLSCQAAELAVFECKSTILIIRHVFYIDYKFVIQITKISVPVVYR